MPLTDELERAITRRVSRDREPLKWRRVRHRESGREGYIDYAYGGIFGLHGEKKPPYAQVAFDDQPTQSGGWKRTARVDFSELDILDAPALDAPVRIRKVLFRGHKEQIAERWRMLGPAPEGSERYVEFDPQPMAYRRWRIVYVGPPLDSERVAETPDQFRDAVSLRKQAKDNVEYDPDPISAY